MILMKKKKKKENIRTINVFSLHIPSCLELGVRAHGQPWYSSPGAKRVKDLSQGLNSGSNSNLLRYQCTTNCGSKN